MLFAGILLWDQQYAHKDVKLHQDGEYGAMKSILVVGYIISVFIPLLVNFFGKH